MPLLVALVLVLAVGYCAFSGGSGEKSAKRACSQGDTMSSIMAANFVKRELRSPSTAKFGSHNNATIIDVEECHYIVRNHVDAQNAFGATVRQYFTVEIKKDPNSNNWRAIEVIME
ncbi:MAG: hypothetical protein Q4G49_03270 [Paracoccus sp. (in: a-proteobacteria)]|nr:hypothetical protein [Paracoccus sp. (in: a-proteobacteria)]